MFPRTVVLGNGYLVLQSKEGEELFEKLSKSGMFWEWLSNEFERKAQQQPGSREWTEREISEVRSSLEEIKLRLNSFSGGWVSGTSLAGNPSSNLEETVVSEKPKIVTTSTTGNLNSILNKAKKMGGKA